MTPERLKLLDDDRRKLGLSRGGFLAAMYDHLGDDAAQNVTHDQDALQQRIDDDEAAAEAIKPFVDAMKQMDAAWMKRAQQRQSIGVHTNQIAKLANVLRMRLRDGEAVDTVAVESLTLALQGINRQLGALRDAESKDDALRAGVRRYVDERRVPGESEFKPRADGPRDERGRFKRWG